VITSTPPRTFATAIYANDTYPPRPSARVVRWVGPTLPDDITGDDEWRPYGAVMYAPGDGTGLVEHFIAANATASGGYGTAITSWPSEVSGSMTLNAFAPTLLEADAAGMDVADFLHTPGNYCTTPDFMNGNQTEFTVTVVVKTDLNDRRMSIVASDTSGANGDMLLTVDASPYHWAAEHQSHSTVTTVTSGAIADTTGYHVLSGRMSQTNDELSIWLDGFELSSSAGMNAAAYVTDRTWELGRRPAFTDLPFNGKIAEVFWHEAAPTDDEMVGLHAYQMDKYGFA